MSLNPSVIQNPAVREQVERLAIVHARAARIEGEVISSNEVRHAQHVLNSASPVQIISAAAVAFFFLQSPSLPTGAK